ncbi:MAG: hypothetical protein JWQ05_1378 [Methylobacterium sp.]|jgi:hypothetical protein|nr:hypothetical protein [Methylobacterium sp.]
MSSASMSSASMSSAVSPTILAAPAPIRVRHDDGEPRQQEWSDAGLNQTRSLVLVPGEASSPASNLGATTLRLVEQSMETIQALHQRVNLISAQARDLIQRTHRERSEQQTELCQARSEANEWRRQAMELELRMREAQLRAREAEMGRREAEQVAGAAFQRARAAEAEVASLEAYLRKISDFLRENAAH